ncbi:MAG: MarR family transcriptional regulator [Candidatus Hodarchaeales archaeon]|jgi:DNA-binding transcriptional regulator GbsR (MarR family)
MSDPSNNKEDNADILKLEEEISNFFEDLFYDRGGSPLLGRIYSLCVLSSPNKPLLQKDLVNRFNVNPSTISRNLKDLENWRFIDRRREPGSREWKYQVSDTSFLDLFVTNYEDTLNNLRERKDDLHRIREHWGQGLSEESKKKEKGKQALQTLDFLISWIEIVDSELETFIKTLDNRFLEMEKKIKRS